MPILDGIFVYRAEFLLGQQVGDLRVEVGLQHGGRGELEEHPEADGLPKTSGALCHALCADADGGLGVPAGQTEIGEERFALALIAALPEAIVQNRVDGKKK